MEIYNVSKLISVLQDFPQDLPILNNGQEAILDVAISNNKSLPGRCVVLKTYRDIENEKTWKMINDILKCKDDCQYNESGYCTFYKDYKDRCPDATITF